MSTSHETLGSGPTSREAGSIRQTDHDVLTRLVRVRWQTAPQRIEVVPAGLGQRRFYRVRLAAPEAPASVIARLEPAPLSGRGALGSRAVSPEEAAPASASATEPMPVWLPEPPLEPLRGFLEDAGLPVPCSYFHDATLGIDLLEDVGDRKLSHAREVEREGLYREACSLVPRLQALEAAPDTIPAFGRVFDEALVITKAWKWVHWGLPGLLGRAPRPSERKAIEKGFRRVAEILGAAPRRLAHRDFKAENLHRVSLPTSGERLVMIDVQGAFLAPPEYDLVCLLSDLQVDLPERLIEGLFHEIVPQLPDRPSLEEASLRFDLLALLRVCKDVSHVVHARLEEGDSRRWSEIPRGLELIERAAGRLQTSLPELRNLTSVIQTLTRTARSADGAIRGPGR
ncbi:MAG: phosphotransferase [bacterium]